MFTGFVSLFDACALYPAPVRDLIIELALADLYRAKWTNQIHEEWIKSLLKNRPELKRENLEKTKKCMNQSIEDCLVEEYEDLIHGIELPDPKDRHILAAAIKGDAQIIVTYNLKDFPNHILTKYNIEAQHPDDFFLNQFDLNAPIFVTAVKRIRQSLQNPKKSSAEYINALRKSALVKIADTLENYIEVI